MLRLSRSSKEPTIQLQKSSLQQVPSPQKRQRGRCLQPQLPEALAENEVVASTVLACSIPDTILFDCTCIFISHMHASRISVPKEDLGCPLVVTTPAGVITLGGV